MMLRIHDLSLVYPDGTRALDAVTLEAGPGVRRAARPACPARCARLATSGRSSSRSVP